MKILMINKFLYPKGGSETYMLQLGAYLQEQGHKVQYFGMDHPNRTVGNRAEAYVSQRDFHSRRVSQRLRCALGVIYSGEARRKLRLVLEDFCPDVCHLNNFNYQLTPAILPEIRKWSRERGRNCRILYTAHDTQLVCPNHLMRNPSTGECCGKCLGGHFLNCVKGRCIHGSLGKSILGALEGWFWKRRKVYRELDVILAPSRFLARQLSWDPVLKEKIVVLRNFLNAPEKTSGNTIGQYVLYFGRYAEEKGIRTLLQAIDNLPQMPFVFAGDGPLKEEIGKRENIVDLGFLEPGELAEVICRARFTVIPSECYENCPFSVMESQKYGVPVLGADIGGIPELIREGENGTLFESRNAGQLARKLQWLWQEDTVVSAMAENCRKQQFCSLPQYWKLLEPYYREGGRSCIKS